MVAIKSLLKLIKRQTTIVVAPQCYAVCDYAAIVYQSIGRVPQLCDNSGPFKSVIDRVYSCAVKYTAGATSVASVLIAPLVYCSIELAAEIDSAIRAASSSSSSACALYTTAGQLGPASLGCTLTLSNGEVQSWAIVTASSGFDSITIGNTSTVFASSTLSSVAPSIITAYITISNPTSTSTPADDNRPNTGTIAGIAVGTTIAVVLILSLIVFLAWRLRRKRKSQKEAEAAAAAAAAHYGETIEKSQLHSDDYRPQRKELEGSKVPVQVREIAGLHEIDHQDLSSVRSEMSANETAASEVDSPGRARSSPTAESSTLLGSSVRSEGGR